jgi:hypothetical protein
MCWGPQATELALGGEPARASVATFNYDRRSDEVVRSRGGDALMPDVPCQ